MEIRPEDINRQGEETALPATDPAPAAEEPILLNKLFPEAGQDLDALFPEPSMKQLLKDVIRTRQKNERFLKQINLKGIQPEEEEESSDLSP